MVRKWRGRRVSARQGSFALLREARSAGAQVAVASRSRRWRWHQRRARPAVGAMARQWSVKPWWPARAASVTTPAEARLSVSPFRIYNDEITITGSMAILRSFAPAVELIASGVVDPRPLLSEPLPLEQYGEALRRVRAGQGIKWHVRPS